jgi:hypothetical protein
MDLQLIKEKKLKLEMQFSKAINAFAKETSVNVTDIQFGIYKNYPISGHRKVSGTMVRLEVEIDWLLSQCTED